MAQGQGKELLYIREVTYRIHDQRSLTNSLLLIKQLRKQVSEREAEQRNVTGLVSQDKLILSKNPRNPKLMGLFIRPNIPYNDFFIFFLFPFLFGYFSGFQIAKKYVWFNEDISGHRTGGTLEAHVNGFRFSTSKGATIGIFLWKSGAGKGGGGGGRNLGGEKN